MTTLTSTNILTLKTNEAKCVALHKKLKAKVTKKYSKIQLSIFALLFIAIGGYFIVNSFAATSPTTANLWVDGGNGTCAYSATATSYNSATACNSISAAFAKCNANDSINLANDISGSQSVSGSKASPGCTVDGQNHTVAGNFNVNGGTSNAIIQNITFFTGDQHATNASSKLVSVAGTGVRFNNFKVHGLYASVYFENANDFQWNGGELGTPGQSNNPRSCVLPNNDLEPMRTAYSTNLTINSVTFHHQDADHSTCYNANGTVSSSNGAHVENIRIDVGTDGLTVKNSTFVDGNGNDSNTIFISNTNSTPNPVNLTFMNNYFGTDVNPTFSSNVSCSTFKFLYNTFHNTPGAMGTASNTCPGGGGTWVGNLGPRPAYYGCTGTYIKNVWQDSSTTACGTDKMVSGTQFAYEKLGLGGTDGFHLTSTSSPAYNAGESTYCAGVVGNLDHDGGTRPIGSTCDAGAHEYGSSAPPASTEHYVTTTGTDSGNCTQAAPCKTFNYAYTKAAAGEIIHVTAGSYPSQSITSRSGLTADSSFTNNVQFKAEGNVSLPGLSVGTSGTSRTVAVNFDGFHVGTGGANTVEASDIKYTNMEFNGLVYEANSTYVTWDHVTVQPANGADSAPFDGGWGFGLSQQSGGTGTAPSNLTISHSTVHGVRATQAADHPDGIFLWTTDPVTWNNIVIDSNVFYNNECINLRTDPGINLLVQNNFFGTQVSGISGCGYYSADVYEANATMKYNTFESDIQVNSSFNAAQSWVGNVGTKMSTSCGVTNAATVMKYNVWTGQKCSTTDKQVTQAQLKLAGGSAYPDKLFLTAGSAAIDAGDPSNHPILDIIGTSRPQGSAPDAGAYEYQSGTTTPKPGDTNNDGLVNIVDLSTLLSHYNTNYTNADFNKDNIVNITDLSVLLTNFGK